jgi:ABC-type glucose/galactose transport system permease subunit
MTACSADGASTARARGSSSAAAVAAAWAQNCVPRSLGPEFHAFDGLTLKQARIQARTRGLTLDYLGADGGCDIGRISITGGHTYVHAAIAGGRIVFARKSTIA